MPGCRNAHAWLLAALLLAAGCTPAFQRRALALTVQPGRIAGLPVFAEGSELDSGNNRKPLDAWTQAMAAPLNAELARWVVGSRGHMFPETDTMMVPMTYRKFRRWTARSLIEIAETKAGHGDETGRHAVDEWQFDQDLAQVRQMLGADFALVTLFHDTRQTGGRVFTRAFSGGLTGALANQHARIYWFQVGAACLVDLNTGRMVWCNTKSDAWPDLSVPANAKTAVAQLLTDLYYSERT